MIKNKPIKSIVGIIVLLVFGLLILWYMSTNWHEFTSIAITNPYLLVVALIIMSVNIYASGAVIDLAMEPHGVKISKYEAFGLANITRFSNQLSPAYIGATIRATYMKRVYEVSYAKFSSSFLVNNLLQLVMSGLLVIATFFMLESSSLNDTRTLFVVGVIMAVFVIALCIPVNPYIRVLEKLRGRSGSKLSKIFERLEELLHGYTTVRKHPGLLISTVGWLLIISFTAAFALFLSYGAIGVQVDFITALFISALSGWAVVLSITPGGIGVKEGLMVVAAQIAGVSIASTLIVAILLRLLMFIASGVFSMYFTPRLLGRGISKTNQL